MNSQFDTVIDSKSDIGHMIRLTKNYVLRQTGNVMDLAVVPVFSPQTCCSLPPGVQPYKYGGKELDRTGGLDAYDFGARSYFADRLQWSTMDPLCEKYYDVTPYGYCHNDPIQFVDLYGFKDTIFVAGKDRPIQEMENTSTDAFNCHTYAWHNGIKEKENHPGYVEENPYWDEDPSNNMEDYFQLYEDEPNIVGDRVIYYQDINGDGIYQKEGALKEFAVHSAIVWEVDENGNTKNVISKMGRSGLSINHPRAPGFYEGADIKRAYFREVKNDIKLKSQALKISPYSKNQADALFVAPRKGLKIPCR